MISMNFKRKLIGYTSSFVGDEFFLSPANDNETLLYLDNFQFENFVTFKDFKKIHSGFNCKNRKNRSYGSVNINEQLYIMLSQAKKTEILKDKCNEDIFLFLLNNFHYKKIMNANIDNKNNDFKTSLNEAKKTIENLLKFM